MDSATVMTRSNAASPAPAADLRRVVDEAWRHAQALDVADIGYGRIHWGNYRDTTDKPGPYYGFLGGLVASQQMHRICEIGTHTGGATRAMHRGLAKPADARVVTIDVTRESDKALAGLEGIQKINGDANHETTAARVINAFADGHTIDLLFIDGAHDYLPALLNFGIYTNALSPRFVVMDDININPDMRALWRKIVASRPADTWLDVATVLPDVRAPDVGFGLIAMPENAAAPALHHRVPAVSPIKRTVRNTLRYLASHRLGRI